MFIRWCAANGHEPAVTRALVTQWVAEMMMAEQVAAGTVVLRHQCVKQFAKWLTAEGILDADPLLGMPPPKADVKITTPLTDEELGRLVKACAGKAFRDPPR